MRKIIITLCGLGLGVLSLTAQDRQDIVPPLAGWNYFGGDEFNGNAIDRTLWGLYGDKKKDYSNETYGNNIGQGMAQTYRDKMVTVQDGKASVLATREPIYTGLRYQKGVDTSPKMRAPLAPTHNFTKNGWWSGFLSSRDADNGGTYYPLYSRIEIKAKIPFSIGTWMALWLRHRYGGAGTFEIDLEEFFVMMIKRTMLLVGKSILIIRKGKTSCINLSTDWIMIRLNMMRRLRSISLKQLPIITRMLTV